MKQKIVVVVLLAASITYFGGCSVLTESQVKEVQRFAKAGQSYGTLPGTVIIAYGEISAEDRLLGVPARTFSAGDPSADQALDSMAAARKAIQNFNEVANQADDALKIIDTYADALVELTSDQFTKDLDESAIAFGKAIDKGIDKYNKLYDKKLSLVGEVVAQVIRGVGGIYIRHKQSVFLREYVQKADPVVQELMNDVERIISGNILLNLEELQKRLKNDARNLMNQRKSIDLATAVRVNETFTRLELTEGLAKSALASAQRYRAAHHALLEATKEKHDLQSQIAEITAFANEVQAAQKLKNKYSKDDKKEKK